ncbi:DUF5060 domain-containing protein [candidate division KSB1 bacterium]|nr:DUF5060 domain-containing protein [candidate division KSB1 bacterium]
MVKSIVSLCSILFLLVVPRLTLGAVNVRIQRNPVPLWEVVQVEFTNNRSIENPFQFEPPQMDFTSPSGRIVTITGYYDGGNIWKARATAKEIGQWTFSWNFDGSSGMGFFTCSPREKPRLHGHLRIDAQNPHKLRFEDGTPLYWFGGKYLCFMRPFGSADLQELSFPERMSSPVYLGHAKDYLTEIGAMGLNGVLLKLSVLPLNYDLQSMNLEFLDYIDKTLIAAQEAGINVQLNLFDSWGKRKENVNWSSRDPENGVEDLLLEPWNPHTFVDATRFYLRYIINRYAAFAHVHWELWNEAERFKVSALAATQVYLPWIREYDPYDLLVGASEMYTGPYPLDMTFPHGSYKAYTHQWEYTHNRTLNDPNGYANNRPMIWNEIRPYDGNTLQDEYDWFRASFWGLFTAGNAGVGDWCWKDIREVPDRITEYLSYQARFVEQLVDPNALEPADALLDPGTGYGWLCNHPGKEAVAYLYTQQKASQLQFRIVFQPGRYACRYYNPKSGEWIGDVEWRDFSSQGLKRFTTPVFDQDIVFYAVEEQFLSQTTPVELSSFEARQHENKVALLWQTLSESNNYGFEILRAEESANFNTIGFVAGQGTVQQITDYRFTDQPPRDGLYHYRLRQIDLDGASVLTSVVSVHYSGFTGKPVAVPNPSFGPVSFRFSTMRETPMILEIYNIRGQRIHSQVQKVRPGSGRLVWNGRTESGKSMPGGVYLYTLRDAQEPDPQKWICGKLLLLHNP